LLAMDALLPLSSLNRLSTWSTTRLRKRSYAEQGTFIRDDILTSASHRWTRFSSFPERHCPGPLQKETSGAGQSRRPINFSSMRYTHQTLVFNVQLYELIFDYHQAAFGRTSVLNILPIMSIHSWNLLSFSLRSEAGSDSKQEGSSSTFQHV
jgi:hypothetical protein